MGEGNKYFMVLDFISGYWQIPIRKESRPETAFMTERGKFVWNVLPQGMRSSSDYFLRITDEALRKGGLTNYVKNFDDLLLFAKSLKEMAKIFQDLLEICRENKITLQPKK